MNTVHAKIENICRLCLSGDDDNLESIFGDSGSELLQMIIYDCTSVKVSPRQGYPSSICVPCRTKVENFHQFRQNCIQNDEYLRTTFLEPEVVIKTEPDIVISTGDDDDDDNNNNNGIAEDEHDLEDDEDDINEADIEEWDESESNDLPDGAIPDVTMESAEQLLLGSGISITAIPRPALVPMFRCEYCSAEFAVLEQLEKHITSHTEEKIFKCFYCPKTFHFAKNLNMHVEYIHSKVKYSQKAATKNATSPPNFLVPNEKHNPNMALSPSNNNNNNNNVTTIGIRGGKPMQLHPALVNRQLSIAPQPPPPAAPVRMVSNHECHVCHKSFSDLRQHMLVHDGNEKPFKCDICSKSFFNASTLKTHYRIHSDENPFRCATCTKVFDNARSLELHHRTHTGERPYSCDVCLKKFSCSSNLKRHRKLHDRD
uniref:C2h2-type zn-finger protein n=1 Tax=Culex tarsalis TaxID=7177 RepID=A0A1Q3FHH4_CULTA